jgi:hypothetical protein
MRSNRVSGGARVALVLSLFSGVAVAGGNHAAIGEGAQELPLFDAHMHYNRDIWQALPPYEVVSLMDENGVAMALVSSTPDDGTIMLWGQDPSRFVPEMRPYKGDVDQTNWTEWDEVGDYIEQRVNKHPHQGIGEFHLHGVEQLDESLLKRIADLAVRQGIHLHVDARHEPVEFLFGLQPELTIIWAHAGMTEPPDVIAEMMARFPSLYADTSYRERDILDDAGDINPEWRAILEKFADRFMVGSDTWANSQWAEYDRLMATNREWLAHLTPKTARMIAYENAERLFGTKVEAGPLEAE